MSTPQNGPRERREALKALGSYQKQSAKSLAPSDLADLLNKESDRGLIVFSVSMLEDMLLNRLLKEFVSLSPGQVKNLTRAGGLLSNLDDRITLAHALGILKTEAVEELQILKAMRNACAHSRKPISFLTKEVKDAMVLLFEGEGASSIRTSESAAGLRFAFVCAFVYNAQIIMGSSPEDAQRVANEIFDLALEEANAAIAKQQASPKKRKKQPAKRPPRNPKD